MAKQLLNIGAPSTVTHDSSVGSYSLAWETLSGISIPDEYLVRVGDAFLRLLQLDYNPNGFGGSADSTFTSRARFQINYTDSGTGSSGNPQMATTWEKRDVAFTIIVGGNRYDVRGPDATTVPSSTDDQSEPYYWRFNSGTSLEALTRAVQEADATTRAAIQLEFDNGLADGVVLLAAAGEHTWTVPDSVTSLKIELVGGGGGGGGGGASSSGVRGRTGQDSELVGDATSVARKGGPGGGGLRANRSVNPSPAASGYSGQASPPGISGSGIGSGSRDIVGLEDYGAGGRGGGYGTSRLDGVRLTSRIERG